MAGLNDHKAKLMIMMMGKKKPAASAPEEDDMSLGSEGKREAMRALMDAFNADDVDAALEAYAQLKEHEGDEE